MKSSEDNPVKAYNPRATETLENGADKYVQAESSHERHKERAFVAASRRTDRSIEARLQSAQRASEIHQRRTGKAFRLSEAIIMNEEMYEEEDECPRSQQLLPPHMVTSSAKMNSRLNSYLKSRAAVSALARLRNRRESQVNEAFAQCFPEINQNLSRHWPTELVDSWHQAQPSTSNAHPLAHDQLVNQQPEDLFSGSDVSSEQPGSPLTPPLDYSGPEAQSLTQPFFGIDTVAGNSAFTSELPPETRMLIGYTDQHGMPVQSSNGEDWTCSVQVSESCMVPSGVMEHETQSYYDLNSGYDHMNSTWDSGSRMDSQMDDLPWEDFIKEISQGHNG